MITIRDLLKAGVHFGHKTRFGNPQMAPYIYGVRDKVHIIDLDQTLPMLQEAINFLSSVAAKRGKILFVGTKLAARDLVKEAAISCGMPYVNWRWLGGMLTNYKTIRQSIKRLKALDLQFEKEAFTGLTKKEILQLTREREKLERNIGGIKNMGGLPDALFIIDVGHDKIAVREARKLSIPIVAVVDTVNSPEGIDYLIPGNDDAIRAIELYLNTVIGAIKDAAEVPYLPGAEQLVAEEEDEEEEPQFDIAEDELESDDDETTEEE